MLRPGSRTIVESQHHVRLDFLIKWRQFCEKSEEPLGSAIYHQYLQCEEPLGSAIYHQYLQCEESLGSAIYRRLSNLDHGGLVGIADQRICVFGLYGLVTFTYRLLHLVLRVTRQQSGLRSIKSSACHCYTVVAVQCTVYVV